eukprot:NODE_17205_length_956_cov_3.909530.p2 GENE.NODE_17205_length_956_cov_3.909530~~NODE_17205_length_956_cov_3.909530.p2  ORF type:complete len:102 (+),score=13.94 NODE_17205_length_956_cov_3.909530:188-493(+)
MSLMALTDPAGAGPGSMVAFGAPGGEHAPMSDGLIPGQPQPLAARRRRRPTVASTNQDAAPLVSALPASPVTPPATALLVAPPKAWWAPSSEPLATLRLRA